VERCGDVETEGRRPESLEGGPPIWIDPEQADKIVTETTKTDTIKALLIADCSPEVARRTGWRRFRLRAP
jgi:ribosomal protein L19E